MTDIRLYSRWLSLGVAVCILSCSCVMTAHADFTLTDKTDSNGVLIPSGNTATSVYVLETSYSAGQLPSTPHTTRTGFTFHGKNSSGVDFLTSPNDGTGLSPAGFKQGYSQSLAGNEENGYVGTNLATAWGNALTLSFGGKLIENGPGADFYLTGKDVDGSHQVIPGNTSGNEKSYAIALHFVNDGGSGVFNDTWHLYNPDALPSNFQPEDSPGDPSVNPSGGVDLSELMLVGGAPIASGDITGSEATIPLGATIDMVAIVANNSQNAFAWGYWGATDPSPEIKAPTDYVQRRDFDNADLDNDGFTGQDFLTGRYGDRPFNNQTTQAWFFGILNTAEGSNGGPLVPEPSTGLMLAIGALWLARRQRR